MVSGKLDAPLLAHAEKCGSDAPVGSEHREVAVVERVEPTGMNQFLIHVRFDAGQAGPACGSSDEPTLAAITVYTNLDFSTDVSKNQLLDHIVSIARMGRLGKGEFRSRRNIDNLLDTFEELRQQFYAARRVSEWCNVDDSLMGA